MKAKLSLLFLALVILPVALKAQNVSVLGIEPEMSYTHSFPKGWKLNGKALLDVFFLQNVSNSTEGFDVDSRVDKLEFSLTAAKRLSPFLSLGAGYLYGNPTLFGVREDYEHRLVQQVAIFQLMGRKRFSQQLKLEERVFDEGMRVRMRFKLAFELPLQGVSLDPGEWYFVSANEGLFDLRDKESRHSFFAENRFQASLGKYNEEKQKMEYGIGYHLGVISAAKDLENYYYLRIGIFLSSN